MALIPTVVQLPSHDNDGKRIPRRTVRSFEARLAAISGGGYNRRDAGVGFWKNPNDGHEYVDRQSEYRAGLEAIVSLRDYVDLLEWAVVAFRQEALYVEIAGVAGFAYPPESE